MNLLKIAARVAILLDKFVQNDGVQWPEWKPGRVRTLFPLAKGEYGGEVERFFDTKIVKDPNGGDDIIELEQCGGPPMDDPNADVDNVDVRPVSPEEKIRIRRNYDTEAFYDDLKDKMEENYPWEGTPVSPSVEQQRAENERFNKEWIKNNPEKYKQWKEELEKNKR